MSARVLLIAAVDRELRAAMEALARAGLDWQVTTLTTGVGKAAAAARLMEALCRDPSYDLVLQLGCAGGFSDRGVSVGDVVIVSEEIFADEGVQTDDGFLALEEINLSLVEDGSRGSRLPLPRLSSATSDSLCRALREECGTATVHQGPAITVSCGSGTEPLAAARSQRWQPYCESMEGAAAALVCHLRSLPFLEIRGVSNPVGQRDRTAWRIDEACAVATQAVILLLTQRTPQDLLAELRR